MAAATAAMMMSVPAARPWNGVLPTRPSSDNVNSVLSFLIVNIAEVGTGQELLLGVASRSYAK